MESQELIAQLHSALTSSQKSLDDAFKLIDMMSNGEIEVPEKKSFSLNKEEVDGDERIIEGIFDGKDMIAEDGSDYPVPANYASKSKLVEGDKLKLKIKGNGSFIYKQIELIPRKIATGYLILDNEQYKVLAEGKMYNILYASVTFFRINVGDEVAILIPEYIEATWGAVENVIPAGMKQRINEHA